MLKPYPALVSCAICAPLLGFALALEVLLFLLFALHITLRLGLALARF